MENRTRKIIKSFLTDNGCTLKTVVERWNKSYPEDQTSPQNITNKLSRGTIKFSEVEKIANLLGYTLEFVKIEDSKKKERLNEIKRLEKEIDSLRERIEELRF